MKKVYICTPVSEDKFQLVGISSELLLQKVFAFIPFPGQLQSRKVGAMLDKQMIDLCDEVWVFGVIGRDCAWEIGYANGLNKKVKFYADENNRHILEYDWMTTLNLEVINWDIQ